MIRSPAVRTNLFAYGLVSFTYAFVCGLAGCSSSPHVGPSFLDDAAILIPGERMDVDVPNQDCRTGICRHNENTDLTIFDGAMYLVHRTAMSQVLGPNSALHVYRSTDGGRSFTRLAILPAPDDAPPGRDLRDPHFYQVGSTLYIKAITRDPVTTARDSDTNSQIVGYSSTDGANWQSLGAIGPLHWSFWRIKQFGNTFYSAAYEDGDQSVVLYTSADGVNWQAGATIYGVAADTPLETELVFFPTGRLLALVRMDGTNDELLGDSGRLRTRTCWADPPYASFDCTNEIDGQRLDGPLAFFWNQRLFVIARKHLQPSDRKRTSLFELSGDFTTNAAPQVKEWGELPSAGDTSYAGVAFVDDHRALVSWYSSYIPDDESWIFAILHATDIWTGVIDFSRLR